MIINTEKTNTVIGFLYYDFFKQQEGQSKVLDTNIFGNKPEEIQKHFDAIHQLHQNSRTRDKYFMIDVDLRPDEYLSDDEFSEVAKHHLKSLNLQDHSYLAVRHYDTAHPHIHIVVSRVDYTGKLAKEVFFKNISVDNAKLFSEKHGFEVVPTTGKGQKKLSEVNQVKRLMCNFIRSNQDFVKKEFAPVFKVYEKLSEKTDIKLYEALHLTSADIGSFENAVKQHPNFVPNYKQELLLQLNEIYKASENQTEFEKLVNDNGLYLRAISDQGKEKYLKYGIPKRAGGMQYFSEKALPPKFRYEYLGYLQQIKGGKTLYTFKEERNIVGRLLIKARNSSKSMAEYLVAINRLESVNVKLHYSGERLNGYSVALAYGAIGNEFKVSQVNRQLTLSGLQKYFNQSKSLHLPDHPKSQGTGKEFPDPNFLPNTGIDSLQNKLRKDRQDDDEELEI